MCRLYENHQTADAVKALRRYRCHLMDALHESQERVDCLDFLIRRMVDDGKIHAIMEANASKAKNRKKSKFQLRYEELMRQQEAMQRGKAQGGKKRR